MEKTYLITRIPSWYNFGEGITESELKRRLLMLADVIWQNAFSEEKPPADIDDQIIDILLHGEPKPLVTISGT